LGVDSSIGLRREDDHVDICKLSLRTEVVVGTVACHATSICGFGPCGVLLEEGTILQVIVVHWDEHAI
jgi:hypothetical protein